MFGVALESYVATECLDLYVGMRIVFVLNFVVYIGRTFVVAIYLLNSLSCLAFLANRYVVGDLKGIADSIS